MFMNDMADTYPEGSALFGAEDPNAAAELVDSDAEQDEGDAAEEDTNDEASSDDSDDSDSSMSGVAGAKVGQKTGAADDFVGSSSGTYTRVDKAPAPSQPSEARNATKPPKRATNLAKTSATDGFVGSSSGTYTRVEQVPAPSQPAEVRKPAKSPKGVTKPAKTTSVEPPVAKADQSTMVGGGNSRCGRRGRPSKNDVHETSPRKH